MSSANVQLLLYAIPALVIAISLHEMMHSVVGYWLGDDTAKAHGRISLNPLKHIDPFTTVALPLLLVLVGLPPFAAARPVPINMHRLKYEEFGMALVGLAGPVTNFVLAIIAAVLIRIAPGGWLQTFLLMSISINIGLGVFNLIPFPPLDGSRVLYALAPEAIQNVMMQIERLGFMAIFFFVIVIFPFMSPIISNAQQFLLNVLVR